MSVTVTIRKGGPELIDRLEPLWLALHAHHQSLNSDLKYFPDDRSWELRRSCYREWIRAEGSFVLIAERAAEPIGYAFVHIKPGPDDTWVTGARIAELETLSIAPAERGRGFGTLLLDAVDAELDKMGIGDLLIGTLIDNEGARRLYERRGLRPIMVYLARFAASDHAGP
ncbi:GNAT family N-acetyltransferase [Nonomuraea recticatena]|uniref:N-acetyltransferase n=1 Tax=Nonomuraea recticatena TaxID=46178 RepID=A0ABN3TBR9_9ACTN